MRLFRYHVSHKLLAGGAILFLSTHVVNVGNFLYNLVMGRLLGPEKYGELGALLSFFLLMTVPLSFLTLLIVKVVASYWGKGKYSSINGVLAYLTPRLVFLGIGGCILLILSSPFLMKFLAVRTILPIGVVGLLFIISALYTVTRAVLQGTLSFTLLAINNFVEVFLKLVLSTLLVIIGLTLPGALLGPLVGTAVVYLLSIKQLRHILGSSRGTGSFTRQGMVYTFFPTFLATLSLTLFLTTDILLVRHFFPSSLAGEYVALITIGKIIYYAVGPILNIMYPLVTSRASRGMPYFLPFLGTIGSSLGIALLVTTVFFLFPQRSVGILFGPAYFGIIPLLGLSAFFILLYTMNALFTYFFLSISYYRPLYFLFAVSLLQGGLIIFFHHSLRDVLWVNIMTSLVYFLSCMVFTWQKERVTILKIFYR